MTEQSNVAGTAQGAGAGGVTTPPASSAGTPAVGIDAEKLSQLVGELRDDIKSVKGEISGLYSRQDKDRNKLGELMDEVRKAQKAGYSETEAQVVAQNVINEREATAKRNALLDQLLAERTSSKQPAGNGANGATDAAKLISDLSLDANKPEVVAVLARGLTGDSLELALRRISYKQPASAAAAPPMVGSGVSAGNLDESKIEQLAAQRNELLKNRTHNKAQIKTIEDELKAAGFQLD